MYLSTLKKYIKGPDKKLQNTVLSAQPQGITMQYIETKSSSFQSSESK